MSATITVDTLGLYLDRLGEIDLLTPEEEVDLSKRHQAGRIATHLLEDARGDLRERLEAISQEGERAARRLAQSNLRLVVSVAQGYRRRGLDLADVIQEGNLGLLKAVDRFDHSRGFRFSTYATWWIRQAITRGLADRSRMVRLPAHVDELVGKLRRYEAELYQTLGREPTDEELSTVFGIDASRLRDIRRAARDLVSLDAPVGQDDATVMDFVNDEEARPEDIVAVALTGQMLDDALDLLPDRNRRVLILRYGLRGESPRTLEEIGEDIGVSRERARQLEVNGLRHLRRVAGHRLQDAWPTRSRTA